MIVPSSNLRRRGTLRGTLLRQLFALLLLGATVMIGDVVLKDLESTRIHPGGGNPGSVAQLLRRFGAEEWDRIRERFT